LFFLVFKALNTENAKYCMVFVWCLLYYCVVVGASAWAAAWRGGLATRSWLACLNLLQSARGRWSLFAAALFALLPASANYPLCPGF